MFTDNAMAPDMLLDVLSDRGFSGACCTVTCVRVTELFSAAYS